MISPSNCPKKRTVMDEVGGNNNDQLSLPASEENDQSSREPSMDPYRLYQEALHKKNRQPTKLKILGY